MEKPAQTQHPVMHVIRRRWSPRAFASKLIEREKIQTILEAASWSASSFNEQPWRFILASRDNEEQFNRALQCLAEKNQEWAQHAPILILTAAKKTFAKNGKPNRVHLHDLGQAAQNLALQATEMGLFVHQMAGVDLDKVRETYHIPDDFEPHTAIAVGYALSGHPDHLDDWVIQGDQAPRTRKPLTEIVFDGTWGEPSNLVT